MFIGQLKGELPHVQGASNNGTLQLPEEVIAFCRRKGLQPYLQMAADLAQKCFKSKSLCEKLGVAYNYI